jgi:Glyoxalase-like domain
MSLLFDHVLCIVDDLDSAAIRITEAGWELDRGSVHAGQGTHNRRLAGPTHYLELLHVDDHIEAARNRLRLDRRANWRTTGASPFGIGLRGQIPAQCSTDFWLYDELGVRIWVHHDNEHAPHRPLVFALELTAEQLQQRAPRPAAAHNAPRQNPPTIRHLRITGPDPPHFPPYTGPPITHTKGAPHLQAQTGTGPLQAITEILTINAIRPNSHP